jgi:hypothetical protein
MTQLPSETELSEIVEKIKLVIESDKYDLTDLALSEIADIIESSRANVFAAELKQNFEDVYFPDSPYTQIKALDFSLGNLVSSTNVRYLAAARIFSSFPGLLRPDEVDEEILAICEIDLDDDEGDSGRPQPKPRWIREWGLRRRMTYQP